MEGEESDRRGFDSVLFDLFGTLVDFRSTFDKTLDRIVGEHDLETEAGVFRDKWSRFVFKGEQEGSFISVREDFAQGLESTLRALGVRGDLTDYSRDVIVDLFKDLRLASLYPEVKGVLASLEASDLSWAVVSNIDEQDLRSILFHHDLRPREAISSEAVQAYKPDPRPFQVAVEGLGGVKEQTLHVGDSPDADIRGAMDYGLAAAWVNRYGHAYPDGLRRPQWELRDITPVPALMMPR